MKIFLVAILVLLSSVTAHAGENSFFAKSGFYDWAEYVGGRQFVRETGSILEGGIRHVDRGDSLALEEKLSLWGSALAYDGVILKTGEPYKCFASHLGAKGYAGLLLPVYKTPHGAIEITSGVGADVIFRTAPGELWTILKGKGGVRLTHGDIELLAGVEYPFYTLNGVDLDSLGIKNRVYTRPRGNITPYGEVNLKLGGRYSAGAYFEIWDWDRSDTVLATGSNGLYGVYQPKTRVLGTGLKLNYQF